MQVWKFVITWACVIPQHAQRNLYRNNPLYGPGLESGIAVAPHTLV